MSESKFINFKALRQGLSFEEVLKHYGVTVKPQPKGHRHVGFCPLPTHQGRRKSPSFSAKLDWGVWQCFGCKASGNVLDFAVRMEGLNPSNPQDLRKVALQLQERYRVAGAEIPASRKAPAIGASPPVAPKPQPRESTLPVVINPPLDFELKGLDSEHPYLRDRGFTPGTIEFFGLGYCNRGLMRGRYVIPLHDVENGLVGYAGRLTNDTLIDEVNPKYKFPGSREREGKVLEFRSSHLVYNANRLHSPVEDLIVVEGFSSVWWLHQHGYTNAVALMGSSCSEEQADIIGEVVAPTGRVWILSDGDDGGEHCAHSVFDRVAPSRWVKWARMSKGQPTDCSPDQLEGLLWTL